MKIKFLKSITHLKPALKKRLLFIAAIMFVLPFSFVLLFSLSFKDSVYPGIVVAGFDIGGLEKNTAKLFLQENIIKPEKIVLVISGTTDTLGKFTLLTSNIDLTYDYNKTINDAFLINRSSNPLENLYLKFFTLKRLFIKETINRPVSFIYSKEKLDKYLEILSSEIYNEPIYPSIRVVNGQIVIDKGISGQELDKDAVIKSILDNISWVRHANISIITNNIDVALSDKDALIAYNRAQICFNNKLVIKFEKNEFSYTKASILKFIRPEGGLNSEEINNTIDVISKDIERDPQNPVFKFEEGVVKEFLPAKDGVRVNKDNFRFLFMESLQRIENEGNTEVVIEIPVQKTSPPNKTEDVNNLGIRELIGTGISYFKGSISSRIHNVGLAASKFNGILIAPEETFSFNKILGDVSKFTGFQQAYIIMDGKTILGDGGGVCQVSTTMFRAVLDAGLPVIERRAHSYRVSYYEQYSSPGIDATVYDPTSDFKFKNDTPNYILIQTTFEPKIFKLTFDFYGTSDGRVSELTKPIVTRPIPPPEDLYTDDPTLPTGQIKQIDWKAWGAKVAFDYKVTREGEILIEKTFVSNYQPWQAKFLRGTGPIN